MVHCVEGLAQAEHHLRRTSFREFHVPHVNLLSHAWPHHERSILQRVEDKFGVTCCAPPENDGLCDIFACIQVCGLRLSIESVREHLRIITRGRGTPDLTIMEAESHDNGFDWKINFGVVFETALESHTGDYRFPEADGFESMVNIASGLSCYILANWGDDEYGIRGRPLNDLVSHKFVAIHPYM